MPEIQIRQSFLSLAPATGSTIESVVSVVVAVTGTRLVYDHWEDGYEADLNAPRQASTQVWGDGENANGIAPGFYNDPVSLQAGSVLALRNLVPLPRDPTLLLYDGRDRVGATRGIVLSRSAWATSPGPLLADAVEVPAVADWGTHHLLPVGQDVVFPGPTTSSMFEFCSLFVMAAQNGTAVSVDADANGGAELTLLLNQGESHLVKGGLVKGAVVTSSKPVQVQLFTGDIGANYESRWFTLSATDRWTSVYYSPVGTAADGDPTYIYLYNPWSEPLTIDYQTLLGSGTFLLSARDTYQFRMPQNSGARFASLEGHAFSAAGVVGANPAANNVHDWGFSLVPEGDLTTLAVCGWGPGSSDLTQNGSPVWATAVGDTTLYVDYNGDRAGPLTDPLGGRYDVAYPVSALEVIRVYEPDRDQTGMRLYTVDGTRITAAWGQDPARAGPAMPYLDVGTTIPSFPVPVILKSAEVAEDLPPAGPSVGDTLEYTVRVNNKGLIAIGNLLVLDAMPPALSYVVGSTTRDGALLVDDGSGTPFPLDDPGYLIPLLLRGESTRLQYRAVINSVGSILNTVTTSEPGVTAAIVIPAQPADPPPPCTLAFTLADGTPVATYQPGDDLYVRVADAQANTSATALETLTVLVQNLGNGDIETVQLTETGLDSGLFQNLDPLPSSEVSGLGPADGILSVQAGQSLRASFAGPAAGDECSATAGVAAPSEIKPLYLSEPGQALDRVDPVATGDTSTATTTALGMATVVVDATSSGSAIYTATAPAFVSPATSTSGSAASFTLAHTPGTGADRLLLVGISLRNNSGQAVTNVTFGGTSLARVGERSNGSNARVEIWSLPNPPSATANVVVSLNAPAQAVVGAATFTGVDQSTPLGDFASATGSSTTPSVVVAAARGQLVFDTLALNANDSTLTPGSGQTERWDVQQSTSLSGGASTEAGAASVTMSWSVNTGPWALAAVPLRSATAKNTLTVAHTTGAADHRLMLVGVALEDDDADGFAVAAVTYEGQPLTRLIQRAAAVEAAAEIWYLVNPPSGPGSLAVRTSGAGTTADELVVGVTTFAGVHPTDPLGTPVSAIGAGMSATVTAESVPGGLVFDTLAWDDSRPGAAAAGQAQLWSRSSRASAGDGVTGGGSTKPGAANVVLDWTTTPTADDWALCAVPIQPAPGGPTTFTQSPVLCEDLMLPAGGVAGAEIYVTILSGTMPPSPAITATLGYGTGTLAASSAVVFEADQLRFTFPPLAEATTVPAGEAIRLTLTVAQPGVTFAVDYDSVTRPSRLTLPTTTVIHVDSLELYSAPYPGGSLVPAPSNGAVLFVRAWVGDPFGAEDITSLQLDIDGPGTADDLSVLMTGEAVVADNGCAKLYEYAWSTGVTPGAFLLTATAREGTEDTVTAQRSTTVPLTSLDLGTPCQSEFTDSLDGSRATSFAADAPVFVRVTDLDQNVDPLTAETVVVTVASTSGDQESVSLTETGANTGVWVGSVLASADAGDGSNSGVLRAPAGSLLTLNYVDPDDPGDPCLATATVPANGPGVAVTKTLIEPVGGPIQVGEVARFRVRVANTGNTSLDAVVLTDTFPADSLAYSSAEPEPDDEASDRLTWNQLGPLAPGETVDVLVTFTGVDAAHPAVNTARVTTGGGPSAEDTATVTVTQAALTVTKTLLDPNPGPASKGDPVVFRIEIANAGSTALATVPLEDTFSGGCFQFVSANPPPDAAGAGSLLWLDLTGPEDLAPGDTLVVQVTLQATGACQPARNTAAVDYATDVEGNPVPPASDAADVETQAARIRGRVFEDLGAAGFGGDLPLAHVTVTLYLPGYGPDGIPGTADDDDLVAITSTDANGVYEFLNLDRGDYLVVEADPIGYASVDDTDGDATDSRIAVSVTAFGSYDDNDFLDRRIPWADYGSIAGLVRNDADADGALGTPDAGIGGVTILLYTDPDGDGDPADGVLFLATTTAETGDVGSYAFPFVPPGHYVVVEVDPTDWFSTADTVAANDNRIPVALPVAGTSLGNDFLDSQQPVLRLGDRVWLDQNGDGLHDPSEPGLADVVVRLYDATGTTLLGTTATDADGDYLFTDLAPGTYVVRVDSATLPGQLAQHPTYDWDGPDSPHVTAITLDRFDGIDLADFGYNNGPPPTAAQLARFEAEWRGAGTVILSWDTLVEIETLGFYVERSTTGHTWERVGSELVPATGQDRLPQSYRYADTAAPELPEPRYRLVEVELNGRRRVLAETRASVRLTATIVDTPAGWRLAVSGVPSATVRVQTAAAVTGPWVSIQTLTLDTRGRGTVNLGAPGFETARFFRLGLD